MATKQCTYSSIKWVEAHAGGYTFSSTFFPCWACNSQPAHSGGRTEQHSIFLFVCFSFYVMSFLLVEEIPSHACNSKCHVMVAVHPVHLLQRPRSLIAMCSLCIYTSPTSVLPKIHCSFTIQSIIGLHNQMPNPSPVMQHKKNYSISHGKFGGPYSLGKEAAL